MATSNVVGSLGLSVVVNGEVVPIGRIGMPQFVATENFLVKHSTQRFLEGCRYIPNEEVGELRAKTCIGLNSVRWVPIDIIETMVGVAHLAFLGAQKAGYKGTWDVFLAGVEMDNYRAFETVVLKAANFWVEPEPGAGAKNPTPSQTATPSGLATTTLP